MKLGIGDILGIGGGALKLGGTIYGGIKASKAMRDVRKNINKQLRENQDWYDRRYNEDATQRADAQKLLQATEERIRQRNRAAAGAAAVGGASTEAAAQAAALNSKEMADTTAAINADAVNKKTAIENKYLGTKAALNDALNDNKVQNAQQIRQAVEGVAQTGSDIASLFMPMPEKSEGSDKKGVANLL